MQKIILPIFLSLLVSACGDQTTRVDEGTKTQALHLSSGTEPQDLDPHAVVGVPERLLNMMLFEGLLARNPKTLALEPAVAESWEVSEDDKTYTFNLRKNAKWSTGEPITAHDFVFSWNRLLHPQLGNQYAYVYYAIVNAEAFNKGELADFSQVGVKALDDHRLEFTLHEFNPLFIQSMADNNTFPVRRATIEEFGTIGQRGTAWTRAGNLVGNGPFLLKEWIPNRIISVERNPNYWDAEQVKLSAIHLYPVENLATEERMFRSGQIHMTTSGTVPADKIAVYKREHPELIRVNPLYGTYFYIFNVTKKPFDDVRVRQALALAIDRDKLVESVTKGGEVPAYALSPVDPHGYSPKSGMTYNLEKARALLAEAGFPKGKGFPEFEVVYNTMERHRRVATAIQQMWKTALNIEPTIVNQEWKVFLDTRKNLQHEIARAGSVGSFADPQDFLDSFITDSGMNDTGWSNERYDELIKQVGRTVDKDKRYSLFQQAEAIMVEEAPLIPLFYYTKTKFISLDVKNWHENMLDYPSFKNVYLARD